MALTDSYTAVAKDIQARLEANKTALGLEDVFYGDQNRIPRTPAVCVEAANKTRELNGLPRRTEVDMTIYVIVYHYKITNVQDVQEEVDTLAEQIEDFLHLDAQLRDNAQEPTVVDSHVRSVESGYQQKKNSMFRATRLTFVARSQVQLPMWTP